MLERRGFLLGLATSALAAPAIVRAASIMPVKALVGDTWTLTGFDMYGEPITETIRWVVDHWMVEMPVKTMRELELPGLTGVRWSYSGYEPHWSRQAFCSV
jgi:hypothetical protein